MGKSTQTDFNDLHRKHGLNVVRDQILKAMREGSQIPAAPIYHGDGSEASSFSQGERPTFEEMKKRYALIVPEGKIWDLLQKKIWPKTSFKLFVTAELFDKWVNSAPLTVSMDNIKPEAAAAQLKGETGLAKALQRYVYLNPSAEVWDRVLREVVPISSVKYAIADCFDQWVKHPTRKEIPSKNLIFDPTLEVVAGRDDYINKFRGIALQPKPVGDDLKGCRALIQLMRVLCNGHDESILWLRRWLAYPLINVGAKMATAVLMHSSVHGAGKSWFFEEVMGGIYGEYKRVFGQAEIESQYNDWVSETLFGVFEEVLSRSQKYAHGGTLKQLITGKRIRINKKFISGWEESNHMNCVFLSNEFQALYVEPSDRRFLVIWPEEKLLDELKKDIENELANGGAAYFYQWLLKTNLDGFTAHTEPPQTDAKRRLIDFGRPGWEVFYLQWKGGDTPYPYHTCLVSQLYTAYKRWCSQSGESQLALNRFSGFISSYEKRRKDVRYLIKGVEKKGAFFEIGQKADKQTQAEWFGKCAEGFEEALFKNEAPRE